jgi:phosphatidylglycerophosphatase A
MNLIALFFSSTFFSGFIFGKKGKGGGLIGSIVALSIQVYFVISGYGIWANIIFVVISFFVGIISIPGGEKFIVSKWGAIRRHTGELVVHDYNQTNIDEVHGQAIAGTSAFLFNITPLGQFILLIISFFLFRFFDTCKTWPINIVENNIKGPFGIMLDDTIGGTMAFLVTIALMNALTLYLF